MWHPGGEPAELRGVFLRSEVAAAAPGLVANSPETDVKRIAGAGSRTHFGQRGAARRRITVLYPTIKRFGSQAAEICSEVRRGAGQFSEVQEFVGAETVRFELVIVGIGFRFRIAPEIGAAGTFVGRTDAVLPIVAVGEASARIADHRRLDFAKLLDQAAPNAIDVGHSRIFTNPHSVVNETAQMFGEMAVDVAGDGAQGLVEKNVDARIGGGGIHGTRKGKTRRVTDCACGQ